MLPRTDFEDGDPATGSHPHVPRCRDLRARRRGVDPEGQTGRGRRIEDLPHGTSMPRWWRNLMQHLAERLCHRGRRIGNQQEPPPASTSAMTSARVTSDQARAARRLAERALGRQPDAGQFATSRSRATLPRLTSAVPRACAHRVGIRARAAALRGSRQVCRDGTVKPSGTRSRPVHRSAPSPTASTAHCARGDDAEHVSTSAGSTRTRGPSPAIDAPGLQAASARSAPRRPSDTAIAGVT